LTAERSIIARSLRARAVGRDPGPRREQGSNQKKTSEGKNHKRSGIPLERNRFMRNGERVKVRAEGQRVMRGGKGHSSPDRMNKKHAPKLRFKKKLQRGSRRKPNRQGKDIQKPTDHATCNPPDIHPGIQASKIRRNPYGVKQQQEQNTA